MYYAAVPRATWGMQPSVVSARRTSEPPLPLRPSRTPPPCRLSQRIKKDTYIIIYIYTPIDKHIRTLIHATLVFAYVCVEMYPCILRMHAQISVSRRLLGWVPTPGKTQGLHARAFIFLNPNTQERVAFAACPHEAKVATKAHAATEASTGVPKFSPQVVRKPSSRDRHGGPGEKRCPKHILKLQYPTPHIHLTMIQVFILLRRSYLSIYVSICLPIYLSTYLPVSICMYPHVCIDKYR